MKHVKPGHSHPIVCLDAGHAGDYFDVSEEAPDDGADLLYCVQVGAFRVRSNAEAYLKEIKAAGFDGYITTQAIEKAVL